MSCKKNAISKKLFYPDFGQLLAMHFNKTQNDRATGSPKQCEKTKIGHTFLSHRY